MRHKDGAHEVCLMVVLTVLLALSHAASNGTTEAARPDPPSTPSDRAAPALGEPATANGKSEPLLVPVKVELPMPIFVGTQEDIRAPRTKPVQTKPGPPFLAPKGTRNVALGKPVSASDEEPVIGELGMITDGDKEAADGSYVELGPFLQHITIDLEAEHEIYGIRAWHYHKLPRVYFDVIVQISKDPDFTSGVQTLFNNDMDNSAGLGVGTDMHYVDTSFGEIFDARGLPARYIRLYSRGNTASDLNHYIEVEVYGRPISDPPKLIPLQITMPKPMIFGGHRLSLKDIPNLEPLDRSSSPLIPPDVSNVAIGKAVAAHVEPIIGDLAMVTNGRKDASDSEYVELPPGLQSVTIDLKTTHHMHAICVWHSLFPERVYFDVIVQVANDPAFTTDVHTVFNNDIDKSSGFGAGADWHYVESPRGKFIDARGIPGRYIRLFSNGNNVNQFNHYVEVEVYGQPVIN